jgi:quinohemoprotein ethanol dehydrogenase
MKANHVTAVAATALLAALLHPCDAESASEKTQRTESRAENARLADGSSGNDWPAYGRTYGEQHFSPLTDINGGNVDKLGLVSWLDLPVSPVATQPIAVDGIIYMSSGLSVVRAVDGVTGKQLWTFDPKVAEVSGDKLRQGWGNRGIAYWNGKVYTGTNDGRLIAVDAKTGTQVWSAQTTENGDGRYITGAPRIMNGRVLIGHGGADSASIRGYIVAHDAETGKLLWRFYFVPGNPADGFENEAMRKAAKTWFGEWWKYGGGGNAWNAMSYDPETDTLFVGTGNGSPWNRRIRSAGKGDNLYLCSIVALNGKTGAYKWHYQINPGETWDYNATMDMHLADVTIDGKVHKALVQAPKNGFLYVLDRNTGKLLAANKIVKVTWAKGIDLKTGRPIENPGIRFEDGKDFELWPSYTGAHSAQPSAYDPGSGLMYIPLLERGASYNDRGIDVKNWKRPPGNVYDFGVNIGFGTSIDDPIQNTSYLAAFNPITGKELWKIRTPRNFNGGLMVTAGGIVFQGQNDGLFNAYDSKTGRRLWSFEAQAPVIGAPIAFKAAGKEYVSVVAGMGTSASNVLAVSGFTDLPDYRDQSRRLLIFAVGGNAHLPAKPPVSEAPADADYRPAPEQEKAGATVYNTYCIGCHGVNGVSGGGAPKLTRSAVPLSREAFASVVRDGTLMPNGMPQYKHLDDAQLESLRQFLRAQAQQMRSN